MREHRRLMAPPAVAAAVAALLIASTAAAKGDDYRAFNDPNGRVAMAFPKDWQVIDGAGDVIATFAQKKREATVVAERFRLNTPLAPDDITDLFAQLETETLKQRQPNATSVTSKLTALGALKVVVIDYSRVGVNGPERARQFSIPIGQDLFRLTCTSPPGRFTKYEATFLRIAQGLKSTAASAAK